MKVKSVNIGEGLPKIVVSTSSRTHKNFSEEVGMLLGERDSFDVIEIRADHFDDLSNSEHIDVVRRIIENFQDTPVIYTYRTSHEGGHGTKSISEYQVLLQAIIAECEIDFVDIEYLINDKVVEELIESAQYRDVKVLLSNHNFMETPSLEEMQKLLYKMHVSGGDVLKLAYQPNRAADVLNVMHAVHKGRSALGDKVAGIAMGEIGVVTRMTGGHFGSCLTYGYAGEEAAPGQVHSRKLRQSLTGYE